MGRVSKNLSISAMTEREFADAQVPIQESPPEESVVSEVSPADTHEAEKPLYAEEISRLQAEVESWKDKALRTAAELENYRRRVQRDLPHQLLQAQMDILRPLLSVLDNLERGLAAAQEAPDLERLKEGVALIHRQFHHTLQKLSVEIIRPEVGALPDPRYHEVLSTIPASEGVQPHTIVEVVEPGYLYHGQLLRPARVITTE
ncbi:MAG: nucleotide exchange factor GrpE [Bacteroidia bacterium]|nr:nucleotide exchange factor GrpE [Bacteroidia bacterium]MDW8417408.1 nucleotide exchange factor GrpE [Bacteroidia bacterium]